MFQISDTLRPSRCVAKFFIPQNNMFASKLATVSGVRARECLLKQLNCYYEMGVTCLLQSPTVRKMMVEPVLRNSLVRIEPLLRHTKSSAHTDVCIKNELNKTSFPQTDIHDSYFMLRNIIILSNQSLTVYEALTLQKCTADVLVEAAFKYLNNSTISANKKIYITNRLIGNLLNLAGRVGDVSCLFYLALHYHRTSRYTEALHVTARVKSRLTQPYIMCSIVDQESYNECVAGWSLSKRMMRDLLNHVRLHNDVYYIQELDLERRVSQENGTLISHISPFVLTEMLSVFCNYRLGNRSQCLQSLTDLQTLLLYDDWRYVPLYIRDLSWQILGICQHVVGDLHGALQSYQQSLSQIPFHKIQNATKYRIAFILNRFSERK
ncbi:uncharacterized protein LOC128177798 [Crassostrea angulata]|uniref:uncharacterized protein LOC128177798 n=1 Tax=Magallana angulata TaxID=2784310 RepID=UPI0022B1B8F1|nr:uncharacterized protein LOC128177798 [Crassostrea angulata]